MAEDGKRFIDLNREALPLLGGSFRTEISVVAFALIRIGEDYGLLINGGRLHKNDEITYSPVGGALQVVPDYKEELDRQLSQPAVWRQNGDLAAYDLRLRLPSGDIDLFLDWLEHGMTHGLVEFSSLREVGEELISETNILGRNDLDGVTEHFLGAYWQQVHADYVRLAYVFEVFLPAAAQVRLQAAAAMLDCLPEITLASLKRYPKHWFYLADASEMADLVTKYGVDIGLVTKVLLLAAGADESEN